MQRMEDGHRIIQENETRPQKRLKLHHTRRKTPRPHPERNISLERPKILPEYDGPKLKSILKVAQRPRQSVRNTDDVHLSFNPSPGKILARLAQDDAEIAFLEKKLGIKGKNIPQSFVDDGLHELLEGLGDGNDDTVLQKENEQALEEECLTQRRKKGEMSRDIEKEWFEYGSSSRVGDGDDLSILPSSSLRRKKENPYAAPISQNEFLSQKYIPPSLRKPLPVDTEAVARLRRQIQGLVNRLTDANLISIVGSIENLYSENARQHVTSVLVDLLLASICEPTSLPDTLIILPAGFIAALYRVIGTDFGAKITHRIVELFDENYLQATDDYNKKSVGADSNSGKETLNLITLLAQLYNFQVVGSNLMFDYIRLFLNGLSELNTELLLKIIRTSGPQLRQDDPSALRDIVALLRPALVALGDRKISARMKFMIETINDLKNNRTKTGVAASSVTSEHAIRMKKTLGTLNNRSSLRASEPLRVGLKDIQDSEKKGKWWLVGAKWNGSDMDRTGKLDSDDVSIQHRILQATTDNNFSSADLVQLAREQQMNTDIRRAIFITIMSASDYQDAYLRILKLKLKKVQQLEIPQVLIHCLTAEERYNPYYAFIARKLCGDRQVRMAFQFNFWDVCKSLDEGADEEDGNAQQSTNDKGVLSPRRLVHVAKMFGSLIAEESLSLSILKNLNLRHMQPEAHMLVEVLLVTVFLETQRRSEHKRDEQSIRRILAQAKHVSQLAGGLHHFIRKYVAKTDIAGSKTETSTVKWACTVALRVLEAIVTVDAVMG